MMRAMQAAHDPFAPPQRLLCGPGPSNVPDSVLAAFAKPMLGHLDPDLEPMLSELVEMLAAVFHRHDGPAFPLSATGTTGVEAGIANLVEPGDTVIVGASGYFGFRMQEIARRQGARVVAVDADWGRHVPNERLLDALEQHPGARLLAVVHAETSTGVRHPIEALGDAMRGSETLLMADCVTALGGVPVDADGWGIDYACSCTQKCLAAPPGMAPVAVSARALERVSEREAPVDFAVDLRLLAAYWIDRPAVYHHTVPVLNIYALHEALRLVLGEGLEVRWQRHADAGAHLQHGLRSRGFELLAEEEHQLPQLTAVKVPDGVDEKEVQLRLLREHGIEVGGGLGPAAPSMWRVGLMGKNATREIADRVLEALDAVGGAPARPR